MHIPIERLAAYAVVAVAAGYVLYQNWMGLVYMWWEVTR